MVSLTGALKGSVCVLTIFLCVPRPAPGQEEPSSSQPHLSGPSGSFRHRITRHPMEVVEIPDVITLKDGARIEAYFLNVYGDWYVFYVKETETSWLREELPRSEIASVEELQYLDRDPVSPRRIVAARKQPVPKEDLLSGVFTAAQGRHVKWEITFESEIDLYAAWSEDATDYGRVIIQSKSVRRADGVRLSHRAEARARYYLYAPHTVNNEDWVLLVSDAIQKATEYGSEKSLSTLPVPDETFILYFSPERDTFRLAWSNLGGWTWAALTQLSFRRVAAPPDAPKSETEKMPPRKRAEERLIPIRSPGARQILADHRYQPAYSFAAQAPRLEKNARQWRGDRGGWKTQHFRSRAWGRAVNSPPEKSFVARAERSPLR